MSLSHRMLRVVMALSSLGLVALVYAAGGGIHLLALALVLVTVYAVARPESVVVILLLAVHAVHWVGSAPVPRGWGSWLWLLLGAWLALLLHVGAAAAVTWPSVAPVPRAALRRWARRTAVVALATVPVWAVCAATRDQSLRGEASMTYVALAGLTLLGGALYLIARQSPLARR
jgi:hypothetical protein